MTTRHEAPVVWISTELCTRGGIASYVRAVSSSSLWSEWNVRHIVSHRDGSARTKAVAYAGCLVNFLRLCFSLSRSGDSIVHLHTSHGASFLRKAILLHLARLFGIRTVLHVHASRFDVFFHGLPSPLRRAVAWTLRRADVVLALGYAWQKKILEISPSSRVLVVSNCVDSSYWRSESVRPSRDVFRVVFCGRVGERKGTYLLLQVWADLLRAGRIPGNSSLTIFGDGDVASAERIIGDLEVGGNASIAPWASPDDIRDALALADVFVLPSYHEGQPIAILEAMSMGLPPVATRVGGIPEVVRDEVEGLLIEAGDTSALGEAISRLAVDSTLR